MDKVKSYTDLDQSRKLAEILPLDSADQTWVKITNIDEAGGKYRHNGDMPFQLYSGSGVPCWSLAKLLDILPKIDGLKPILDLEECSIQYSGIDLYISANNLVNACVDMIIKLHEKKLL